jgi:hypothetical protein
MGNTATATSGVNVGELSGLTESMPGQQHFGNGPGRSLGRFCGTLSAWSWQHDFLQTAGVLSHDGEGAGELTTKQHHPGGGTRRSPLISNRNRIAIFTTIYSSS